ncbi:hypothetical protein MKK75_30535 [Methylobacterium sp. J-030]|uniref:hypothetical protein n=1 Tax=Methylobacterium sp. J-030 TaxID=2836627 RepID=UPI001FB9579B|nr:hypothetical protein [Methylobacterium sp. J-030]MCJ2073081.1 hypothetical protein [Methylobacterium sp. J-030]
MANVDTDALCNVAERVHDTATQQGVEGQVIVTKTGIRLAASAKKGGSISKRDVPWDQVSGAEFERMAQDAFNEALADSKKNNP